MPCVRALCEQGRRQRREEKAWLLMAAPSPLGALKIYDREAWLTRVQAALVSSMGDLDHAATVHLGIGKRTLYRWIAETPELKPWHGEAPPWHKNKLGVYPRKPVRK